MMRLLFAHGWAMEASLWTPLRSALGGCGEAGAPLLRDPGYFGEPLAAGQPDGPVLAIGHSLGLLQLLLDPPAGLAGLVSINGFSRFSAAPDHPSGVAPRVLRRLRERLGHAPRRVVDEFRRRCGLEAARGTPNVVRLAAGLTLLETSDARPALRRLAVPVLAIGGLLDPVASPGLTRACFADPLWIEGGHALPASHPAACAAAVRGFLRRLT